MKLPELPAPCCRTIMWLITMDNSRPVQIRSKRRRQAWSSLRVTQSS